MENQTIQINSQLMQIFTLLDMLLKVTVVNIVKNKDGKIDNFIRKVESWGKRNGHSNLKITIKLRA